MFRFRWVMNRNITKINMLSQRQFYLHFMLAGIVLLIMMYSSTGTLAIYGATLDNSTLPPVLTEPCQYLLNTDWAQFYATFSMLDGAPRNQWETSPMLRRIFYPLLSYIPMKFIGWYRGGLLTNAMINLMGFITFVIFARRKWGNFSGVSAAWLLVTYPGVAYWIGTPFLHASIVPTSLWIVILMSMLFENRSITSTVLVSLSIGLLFLAYDFFPIFGLAITFMLSYQRRWKDLIISLFFVIAPGLILNYWLVEYKSISLINANTQTFAYFIQAYLNFTNSNLSEWLAIIIYLPWYALHNFLFSNFVFLPFTFLVLVIWGGFQKHKLNVLETAILLAAICLFLFINLAPPIPDWWARGTNTARFYQPIFAAMLFYICRFFSTASDENKSSKQMLILTILLCVLGNSAVVLGPITVNSQFSSSIYHEFYKHVGYSKPLSLYENLITYGRRPLGFCGVDSTRNRWIETLFGT